MNEIRWNKIARLDFFENVDYLLQEWSEKEAQKFIDKVYEIEYLLKQGKVEFQDTDILNIKRCVVCKHVTLFYKIIDNQNIEFLRFWNNYKDDKKLNL